MNPPFVSDTGDVFRLEQFAIRQFQHNLRDHVRQVQADLPQAPSDLFSPDFLHDALKELRLLMLSYDSSLAPPSEKESEFMPILKEALDPYLKGCESLAGDLSESSRHIFMLNCLLAAKVLISILPSGILVHAILTKRNSQTTLEQFTFTKEKLAQLEQEIEIRTFSLVDYLYSFFLENSGLKPLLAALSDWDSGVRFYSFY